MNFHVFFSVHHYLILNYPIKSMLIINFGAGVTIVYYDYAWLY